VKLLMHNELSVISAALLAVGNFVCLFNPGFPIGSSVLPPKGCLKLPSEAFFFLRLAEKIMHNHPSPSVVSATLCAVRKYCLFV
jgi:hypothetical protein